MAANGTRTITVRFDGDTKGLVASAAMGEAAVDKFNSKVNKASAAGGRDAGTAMGGFLVAGLAAAAPLAGAAITAGVGLGLAGAIALVDKGDKQVQASFKALRSQATQELHAVAQGTSGEVVTALRQASGQAKMLGPDLAEAFALGAKNIPVLESGVGELVHNLMPGFLAEVRNSGPVVQGVEHFLADLGTAGSNVFTQLSGHSVQFERVLDETGNIVTEVGDVVGKVIGGMSAGFGTTASTVLGLVSALDAIGGPLGTLAGFTPDIILGAKAYGLAASGADALSGKLSGLAGKITGTGKASSLLRTSVQGIADTVGSGGTLAVGIGVAEYWLTVLGSAEQDAADKARDHSAAVNETATVIEQYGNVTSAAAQHTEAAFLQQQSWVKTLESTGVSLSTVTQAALGNQNALDQVNAATLKAGAAQGIAGGITSKLTLGLDSQGERGYQVAKAFSTLTGTYKDAKADAQQLAGVTAGLNQTQADTAANTSQLSADMKVLKDNTATADDKIKALQDDLALLADHGMEKADDAMAGFYDQLASLTSELGSAKGPILNSAGALDLMSGKGRDVLKALEGARDNMVTYAQSAADAGRPLSTVNTGLQGQYNALVKTLTQMGLSKTAAKKLLDQYKLLPADITTNVHANTGAANSAVSAFQRAVNNLHGKNVALKAVANTAPAQSALETLVGRFNGKTIVIRANVAEGTISALGTTGHRASGGPVMANRPYIVGERGEELFVPSQSGTIVPNGQSVGGDTITLEFAGEVLAQIIDGRLKSYNRDLVRAVKAGSKIR